MRPSNVLYVVVVLGVVVGLIGADECEVCVGFLERLYKALISTHSELSHAIVEEGLVQTCAEATGKESRLCYYLGASSDAAARVTGEVTRPLSAHVPPPKICQRLQKRDGQICELRYDTPVLDWSREVLSKLRVLELKRLLASWGEECRACLEKGEFIDLIQQVAPKHSASMRQEHSPEL
ncbi:cerebral dopamine neurotrophic factor [Clupea harengus]|uniref:Cerebral dopamine neurotrophic factor n=1 Tax=Clupea harengus TaxID=7950 RepID=A0A6P3VS99_CLUHA|nr:cerebral dopamine neurotrophic factor [Clupea harengus]